MVLAAMMMAGMGAPDAIAKPNLNPEYGDAAYSPFTLFSPDSAGRETDKNRILLVFHGYASAVPNGTFKRVRKRMLDGWTTIGVNYDPIQPAATAEFIRTTVADRVQGKTVAVLGTSQGGWWANWTAQSLGADKLVMLNPVISPAKQLAKYIGVERENIRRQTTFVTEKRHLDAYTALAQEPATAATFVILTRDDERQSFRIAEAEMLQRFNTEVLVYDFGGHTINLKKHPALDRIELFLKR